MQALSESVSLRVECGAVPAGGAPAHGVPPGSVDLVLAPGARLSRRGTSAFDLHAGSLTVATGPLSDRLLLYHGQAYAEVRGTRFEASVAEGRLVVRVEAGEVLLVAPPKPGRGPEFVKLGPGEEGLVAPGRRPMSKKAGDGPAGRSFLTPRLSVSVRVQPVRRDGPLALRVVLEAGAGGPVSVFAFEDSRPTLVVRLKGPDGATREEKILKTMLKMPAPGDPPDNRSVRLADEEPYELLIEVPGLALEPGPWKARVRYTSYRAHATGDEWLGVVESAPVPFEVSD